MWNVNILDKGTKDELITLQVEFTKEGAEPVKKNFAGNTKEDIDRKIKSYKDALEKRDDDFGAVVIGAWTEPVEDIPAPTQEEIDRKAWIEKWQEYKGAKKGMSELADAGVTPTEEEVAAFEALKIWVADNRKPEYTHYLGD